MRQCFLVSSSIIVLVLLPPLTPNAFRVRFYFSTLLHVPQFLCKTADLRPNKLTSGDTLSLPLLEPLDSLVEELTNCSLLKDIQHKSSSVNFRSRRRQWITGNRAARLPCCCCFRCCCWNSIARCALLGDGTDGLVACFTNHDVRLSTLASLKRWFGRLRRLFRLIFTLRL